MKVLGCTTAEQLATRRRLRRRAGFPTFPTVEGLVAQACAAGLALGSYFVAERGRPVSRALEPASQS